MLTAKAASGEGPSPAVAAAIFAALGDGTRLGLVQRLRDGRARSIAALCQDTTISRQAVTKHLQVLEGAGLVTRRRVGRESQYLLSPAPLQQARGYLDEVSARWDEALVRLQTFVEDEQDPERRGGAR
jgi:DNA-binding transcriptional ArsR family regulator